MSSTRTILTRKACCLNNPTSFSLRAFDPKRSCSHTNQQNRCHNVLHTYISPSHTLPCSIKRGISTTVHSARRPPTNNQHDFQPSSSSSLLISSLVSIASLLPSAALADELVSSSYNPGDGEGVLKTAAGVGYLVLVAIYFLRLFSKRAKQAKSERIGSVISASESETVAPLKNTKVKQSDSEEDDDEEDEEEDEEIFSGDPDANVTPINTLVGATQAAFICTLLFQGCKVVDAFFDGQTLPTQYTAHNIAILVQTVVRGLAYLLTFIFGANALGLSALTVQLIIFPDSLKEEQGRMVPKDEPLPKVSLTDDIFAIRKAFELAERQGKAKAANSMRQSNNTNDSKKDT